MKLTNSRNLCIYRAWSAVYDPVLGWFFGPGRRRAAQLLDAQPGERVLLVGVGTGIDLPLLPMGVDAVGIDLCRPMLRQAAKRGCGSLLVEADAQWVPLRNNAFDAALLNLVLSVVPEGALCLREALRVVKPGGKMVVFDKFVEQGAGVRPMRRVLNAVTTLGGTDITRSFTEMTLGAPCVITHEEPSLLRGTYRVLTLQVTGE